MVSKKQLTDLIKSLKKKTGKTQEEISVAAGYKPKSLTQLISKGDIEPVYNQLTRVFAKELNNSTQSNGIEANLKEIARSLENLENGQMMIRAEVRGFAQYQIQLQGGWDQKKFLDAMAKVGMLIGANLQAGDLGDTHGVSGT